MYGILKCYITGFPCGLVVKTLSFSERSAGSIPDCGTQIPRASQPKKAKHKTEEMV